jgi:hypothetical protein
MENMNDNKDSTDSTGNQASTRDRVRSTTLYLGCI